MNDARALADSPLLAGFNRVAVPVLLGMLVAYANQIVVGQHETMKTLAAMQASDSGQSQTLLDHGAQINSNGTMIAQHSGDISDLKADVATLKARSR